MTPQVTEKNVDIFKNLSSEERRTISSLNNLSELYKGGFMVIKFERVQTPILDIDQTYFWTDEWQKDEKEIDEEFKKGNFKTFSNTKDLIAHLRK